MADSVERIEKNVQASFGYVKKDLLKLHDIVSSMQNELKHLSLDHATLLTEIVELRRKINELDDSSKSTLKSRKILKN